MAILSRWLRALVSPAGAHPARERAPRIRPVRRSGLGAFWQARACVRAGVGLDDFLRARLARYFEQIPISRARLPIRIEIAGGQARARSSWSPPPAARGPCEDWLAPLVALEGPGVRQEPSRLEARLAGLEAEIQAARGRVTELSRKLDADVAAGTLAAKPRIEATAEQLGRPPIRSAAPRTAALGLAAAALVAESWQVAVPLLRSAGLEPAGIGTEALRRPADVAFLSLFALGVAAGIFALAHVALGACMALFRDDLRDERRRRLASGALAAGLLATLVATAVAALRAAGAGSPAGVELVLLLVAVPIATSLLLRAADRSEQQRTREREAALAWDRECAAALGERVRRDEELASAAGTVRALEEERQRAREQLQDLARRALAAERSEAEAERSEGASLVRLAQSILDALELDRYDFIREASSRRAPGFVAPERGELAEQRATLEAVPPRRAASELEKGRLAS